MCPTCSHTMQGVGDCGHWCPRCGTLVPLKSSYPSSKFGTAVPKLVECCRTFAANENVMVDSWARKEWEHLGIAESINVPDDR